MQAWRSASDRAAQPGLRGARRAALAATEARIVGGHLGDFLAIGGVVDGELAHEFRFAFFTDAAADRKSSRSAASSMVSDPWL